MSDHERPAVVRFRSACPDLAAYQDRHAVEYKRSGVFVPSSRPDARPVGTRVHLKIELADRTVAYSGGAIVVEHVRDGGRVGYVLRPDEVTIEVELEEGERGAVPPTAIPTSTPAPRAPPRPELLDLLFGEDAPAPAPSAPAPGAPASDPFGAPAAAVASAADPFAAASEPAVVALPARGPDAHAPGPVDAAPGAPPQGDADPGRPPGPPAERSEVALLALPRPSLAARLTRPNAIAAVAVLALAAAGAVAAQRHATEVESAFAARLSGADERIRAGRLAVPVGDAALDHLAEARRLLPEDPRLASRGKALADALEALGRRAVERGDLDEAAAHYRGALRADPARASARAQLETIARIAPRRRDVR